MYVLYGLRGKIAVWNLGFTAHEVHHLSAGHQLLLHLEHAVVDLGDKLHDLHYIVRAGHQIADEHVAVHDQNGSHGDAADVSGLADEAENRLKG